MNKTKIDWADMSWNPVTGCLHGCEYCYAKKIANRLAGFMSEENEDWKMLQTTNTIAELEGLQAKKQKDGQIVPAPYPFGFMPTLHKYRLDEPPRIRKPQTVFVCSMADLFGDWVPDEWVRAVFKACEAAPQHRYLFLTKNAARTAMWDQSFQNHKNWWCGISVPIQATEHKIAEMTINANRFVSIEPILEPIGLCNRIRIPFADWVIVGAETGNRKAKVVPQKEWIDNIVRICRENNIPVFMKESLRRLMNDDFIQEYPWKH